MHYLFLHMAISFYFKLAGVHFDCNKKKSMTKSYLSEHSWGLQRIGVVHHLSTLSAFKFKNGISVGNTYVHIESSDTKLDSQESRQLDGVDVAAGNGLGKIGCDRLLVDGKKRDGGLLILVLKIF